MFIFWFAGHFFKNSHVRGVRPKTWTVVLARAARCDAVHLVAPVKWRGSRAFCRSLAARMSARLIHRVRPSEESDDEAHWCESPWQCLPSLNATTRCCTNDGSAAHEIRRQSPENRWTGCHQRKCHCVAVRLVRRPARSAQSPSRTTSFRFAPFWTTADRQSCQCFRFHAATPLHGRGTSCRCGSIVPPVSVKCTDRRRCCSAVAVVALARGVWAAWSRPACARSAVEPTPGLSLMGRRVERCISSAPS